MSGPMWILLTVWLVVLVAGYFHYRNLPFVTCRFCGNRFPNGAGGGASRRVFCSDACFRAAPTHPRAEAYRHDDEETR